MRNCIEVFWNFFDFLKHFLGIFPKNYWSNFFWRNFFGGIFWEKFFGRIFLGGFFWEDFFGRIFWEDFLGGFFGRIFLGGFFGRNSLFTLLKSAKLFEYGRNWFVCQDFGFCQDFVSRQKEGRRKEGRKDKNLDPWKCDCKYIALKNKTHYIIDTHIMIYYIIWPPTYKILKSA